MNRPDFSPLALALALLLGSAPVSAQQASSKVSSDIHVGAGQAAGALDTVSGDITVDGGASTGGINSVSGDIELGAGARVGSLNTVSGDIDLASKATAGAVVTVSGDIHAGDDVQMGDVQTVSGDIRFGMRARSGSAQTVSGDVRFGEGGQLARAETVSGDVFIARGGRVARGVQTVSGAIGLVASDVGGDVLTYTGNVTVGIGSHVRGGLTVRKPNQNNGIRVLNLRIKPNPPRIVIGPNARVDGALRFEHQVKLYVHASARTGPISGASPIRFDTPVAPND